MTTPPAAADLTAGLTAAISADVTSSDLLTSGPYAGQAIWLFGDTIAVNGVNTTGYYGYPHSAFALQTPGTTTWEVLPGPYGPNYGGGPFQQIPNWSDGSFFWAANLLVDAGVVVVLGNRITAAGGGFTVGLPYAATFSASTLAYIGITQVAGPAGEVWDGAAQDYGGAWWISGTRSVVPACTFATNCKIGDIAKVASGHVASKSWTIHQGVFPATDNTGTVISLDNTGSGWEAYTKEGDGYGSNSVQRWSATAPGGPWALAGTYPAPSQLTSGQLTYGAQAHPEQPAPASQVLVSVNENDASSGGVYGGQFAYLPAA